MTPDLTALRTLVTSSAPVNWVLTGDSITHGLIHTIGARSYAEHLHELIRGDLSRVQDVLINTAISGWRIGQLLEDFERRVATWHPHIVTLMIGTNDASTGDASRVTEPAAFAASVTDLLARVRRLGAIPVLQTPPAVDVRNAPERARIADFAQAIRDVAAAQEVILVDHFARFAQLGDGRQGGIPWGLMNDPFHPGAAGHAALALGIAETLGLAPESDRDRVLAQLRAQVQAAR